MACLVAALTITALSIAGVITCKDDQGLGSLVLMVLELPLLLLSYKYGNQSSEGNAEREDMVSSAGETPLMESQFVFLRKKRGQLILVKVAFLVSLGLHVVEMACYYLSEENIMCHEDSNLIRISGPMEFFIMCIESLSELFPHFIIPFIFWYFPYKAANVSNRTFYVHSTPLSSAAPRSSDPTPLLATPTTTAVSSRRMCQTSRWSGRG